MSKEKNLTYPDFAAEVLKDADAPMTPNEIWDAGENIQHRIKRTKKSPKTPVATLGSALYRDIINNAGITRFARDDSTGPFRYYLVSKGLPDGYEERVAREEEQNEEQEKRKGNQSSDKEKHLHPLLAYFVSSEKFARGKNVATKTIDHNISTGKNDKLGDWLHPDMVGFYMPADKDAKKKSSDKWEDEVVKLNKATEKNALKFYSFELKMKIVNSNCRNCFFQAVSNSSWAHEGYLVVAELDEDNHLLMSELGRLSAAFGIGVIRLNLHNFNADSKVLFSAQTKANLDWETINKLARKNSEFTGFIDAATMSFEREKIVGLKGFVFDELILDPEEYIKKHKMA